ncbi:MAG: sialate O-acetylesterase [Ketobacteraceae bacterium]|nr:sialate O-acetylesterase [Ketobacteraceae bacterium]
MLKTLLTLTFAALGIASSQVLADSCDGGGNGKLKVFILAGQSNMVGTGIVSPSASHIDYNGGMGTLEYLVSDPGTRARYQHLINPDGSWASRDDVWLVDLDASGPVSVAGQARIGPDLQFSQVVGDYYQDKVLVIKIAWGGKSLFVDFRPPSSGGDTGPYYLAMIDRIREVLGNIGSFMPGYDGRGYEIVGFGWHQGWNDRVNQEANDEYQYNLVNFINDVRAELNMPDMPFVLATTGMSGWQETHPRALSLMAAQLAAPDDPNLKAGKVRAVETRDFWRDREISPSNQGYHWNNNAETYFLIGDGMGNAMTELLCDRNPGNEPRKQYEAEDFTAAQDTSARADNTGFTGTGYADFGGSGSWMEWDNVAREKAGNTRLTFRYACGSSNRPSRLFINGQEAAQLAFASTGSWATWETETVNVPLKAGDNTIRIVADNNGGPNLDHVKLGGGIAWYFVFVAGLWGFSRRILAREW